MNIGLLISFALLSFGVGLWMRRRKQRPPRWQRWLEEAIRSYEKRQFEACIEQAQKAEKAFAKSQETAGQYLGLIHFYIGRSQLDLSRFEAAETSLKKSQSFYKKHPPEDPMYVRNLQLALADLYFATNRHEEAAPFFEESIAALEADPDMENAREVKLVIFQRMAELKEKLRDYEAAIQHYEVFLETFAEIMGQDHPGFQRVARHRDQLVLGLKARAEGFHATKYPIQYQSGETGSLQGHYLRWLVSPHPQPHQEDLNRMLKKASQLHIRDDQSGQEKRLTEARDLGPLKACLRIENQPQGHKNAHLGLHLSWSDPEGQLLAHCLYLGDGILRWEEAWKDDTRLENPSRLEEWLDQNFRVETTQ
jgi:tetratricopeptide (TPR) repeat protein